MITDIMDDIPDIEQVQADDMARRVADAPAVPDQQLPSLARLKQYQVNGGGGVGQVFITLSVFYYCYW